MTDQELDAIKEAIAEVDDNFSPPEISWARDAEALVAEVERLRALLARVTHRTLIEEPTTAYPARDPEALLIPNGGTGIVDFTCGRCGRRNRVTVLIDAGEKANLPVECGCSKEPWTGGAEVKPYDTQWHPPA